MLDALKMLIELASSAIPSLTGWQKKRKITKIGAELYTLYIYFNEALIHGEGIIDGLELYVRLSESQDPQIKNVGAQLVGLVEQQREALSEAGETLLRWRAEFQVLDGDAYYDLVLKIRMKRSALEMLLSTLRQHYFPTSSFAKAIAYPFDEGDSIVKNELIAGALNLSVMRDREANLAERTEVSGAVRAYLDSREPRKQLQEIRQVLQQFRSSLEETFVTEDVLPAVGKRRL